MTRHSIKAKPYAGDGGGTEITLRIVIDAITMGILTKLGDDAAKHILDMVKGDLHKAIKEALAPPKPEVKE